MAFCPHCGNTVSDTEKFCRACGGPLPSAPPTGRSEAPKRDAVGRGLRAAILVVAILCVATGALWALWPHIRPTNTIQSAGGAVAIASSPAPRATPAPSPRNTASPTASPAPTAAPAASVASLTVGSFWKGTMKIYNYVGDEPLNSDTLTVYGYIGVDDGTPFFEIYDGERGDSDTSTLLSMYVDLYDDHMVPVIGIDDAWFFEVTLTQDDVAPLTIYLINDFLSVSYSYRSSQESCDLHIVLYPDS